MLKFGTVMIHNGGQNKKVNKVKLLKVTLDSTVLSVLVLRAVVHICRSGWHLSVWRLGRAGGYHQPERHRSSWEICPVLPGLVCHTHLSWRLPSSDERLHWYVQLSTVHAEGILVTGELTNSYLLPIVQEGRVSNRGSGRLACPHFPPKRRATSRGPVTSSALVISPPATSPKRTTQQVVVAAATSLTVTWLSWLTHDGLIPGLSGSTPCLGVSDVFSTLSRWLIGLLTFVLYLKWSWHVATLVKVIKTTYCTSYWFVSHLDSVWKPNDLCDWEWSLWEDVVHRAVWRMEDTVL